MMVSGQPHAVATRPPAQTPRNNRIGGCGGPGINLDSLNKKKMSSSWQESMHDSLDIQPTA